jgi:hypothetical protein
VKVVLAKVCWRLYVTPFDAQAAVPTEIGGGDGIGGGSGGGDGGNNTIAGAGGAGPNPTPVTVHPLVVVPFDRLASCAALSATPYTCRSANNIVLLVINKPAVGGQRIRNDYMVMRTVRVHTPA